MPLSTPRGRFLRIYLPYMILAIGLGIAMWIGLRALNARNDLSARQLHDERVATYNLCIVAKQNRSAIEQIVGLATQGSPDPVRAQSFQEAVERILGPNPKCATSQELGR